MLDAPKIEVVKIYSIFSLQFVDVATDARN